ncbi:hypothetical protein OJAV_G00043540 [Oryzias javanicus]|uniref:Uncharacterized protein n=1 Tax=Oryzias javanicus TaxID=123683 RepID=A0A3S2Q7K7_ORYJA|nr:hypothetical protein OJAV_G00043540 [Oryzias javanicus]
MLLILSVSEHHFVRSRRPRCFCGDSGRNTQARQESLQTCRGPQLRPEALLLHILTLLSSPSQRGLRDQRGPGHLSRVHTKLRPAGHDSADLPLRNPTGPTQVSIAP